MIEKTINALVQGVVTAFARYGIRMQAIYNPDLDNMTEYTKSYSLRHLFKEQQLDLIGKKQLEELKKESYVLLMYNYSPLRRVENRLNNFDMSVVLNPNTPESLGEFGKLKLVAQDEFNQFYRMIRDANSLPEWFPELAPNGTDILLDFPPDANSKVFVVKGLPDNFSANTPLGLIKNWDRAVFDEYGRFIEIVGEDEPPTPKDGSCRDLMMGQIELTFKILTSSTRIINDMQFVYVSKIMRNLPLTIPLDFGEGVGVHEFEYSTEFGEIDSVGHVDYTTYGNLQHLDFSGVIEGPFFSFYSSREPYIMTVEVQSKFFGGDIIIPDSVVFPDGV